MTSTYMSLWVSLGIIFCGLLIIWSIVRAIIRREIPETFGIAWLIPAVFIVLGGCFPGAIVALAKRLGVDYPPVIVITFAVLLLFYLVFRCTKWIAGMNIRMQELGMQVSLVNEENLKLRREVYELSHGPLPDEPDNEEPDPVEAENA